MVTNIDYLEASPHIYYSKTAGNMYTVHSIFEMSVILNFSGDNFTL